MDEVRVQRTLPVPPPVVWQALTTDAALAQWFWPPSLETSAQVDLRAGGRYRIASQVADLAVSGPYTNISAPELLEFGWRWDGESLESAVTITLAASDAGTELSLVHRGLAETETGPHATGWSDCLDRLPAWLAAR